MAGPSAAAVVGALGRSHEPPMAAQGPADPRKKTKSSQLGDAPRMPPSASAVFRHLAEEIRLLRLENSALRAAALSSDLIAAESTRKFDSLQASIGELAASVAVLAARAPCAPAPAPTPAPTPDVQTPVPSTSPSTHSHLPSSQAEENLPAPEESPVQDPPPCASDDPKSLSSTAAQPPPAKRSARKRLDPVDLAEGVECFLRAQRETLVPATFAHDAERKANARVLFVKCLPKVKLGELRSLLSEIGVRTHRILDLRRINATTTLVVVEAHYMQTFMSVLRDPSLATLHISIAKDYDPRVDPSGIPARNAEAARIFANKCRQSAESAKNPRVRDLYASLATPSPGTPDPISKETATADQPATPDPAIAPHVKIATTAQPAAPAPATTAPVETADQPHDPISKPDLDPPEPDDDAWMFHSHWAKHYSYESPSSDVDDMSPPYYSQMDIWLEHAAGPHSRHF